MRFPWRCLILIGAISILQFVTQIAKAQTIPARGTETTFDVATWNIEWFGSDANGPSDDARQLANVKAVVEQAGIDLWGLQEITDPEDFEALLEALGDGYDGVLATESGTQRIGFIYNTHVFSNLVVRHILTSFSFSFAGRLPLQLEADVTLAGETRRLTFIVLHMKAFADQQSYQRRVDAAQRLKNHIDFLRPNDPIVVLGDFNDALTGSIRAGQPSPYEPFLQDPDHYFFPSLSIEEAGLGTFCGSSTTCTGGATVDHILVTDELAPFYEPDSAARFDALLDAFDGTGGACGGEYVCTTSDHLPVFARFFFGLANGIEDEAVPEAVILEPAYPHPVLSRATLPFTLPHAAAVRIEVFDALGRRVAVLADGFRSAGTHRALFEAEGLPAGVYLIRLSAGRFIETRRVVRVR